MKTCRICKNIRGQWTLGYYSDPTKPGTYTQHVESPSRRSRLVAKAKSLGFTHYYKDHEIGNPLPIEQA